MLTRRRLLTAAASLAAGLPALRVLAAGSAVSCGTWPAWERFRDKFIQADGRVIDFSAGGHSTSEGQAYSLFFALVANDRDAFNRILTWTRANLAEGDFSARLMAWKWGQRGDGSWGVIDTNAASDADVWLAYVLFQAARLWKDDKLGATARLIEARLRQEVVVQVKGVGTVLLPGPNGFALDDGAYKLNPSYLPLQVLHGLAREVPGGPWKSLAQTTVVMLDAVTPRHLAPDWITVQPEKGFLLDARTGSEGSYDAIRTYLWAALLPAGEERTRLLGRLSGMRTLVEQLGVPPEKVDAASGSAQGSGPLGFSAALLPYLDALKAEAAARRQRDRLLAANGVPQIYYEQALALFADGWLEQRYRFEPDGRLTVHKKAASTASCKP